MYVSEHLKWRILIAQALKSFHFERENANRNLKLVFETFGKYLLGTTYDTFLNYLNKEKYDISKLKLPPYILIALKLLDAIRLACDRLHARRPNASWTLTAIVEEVLAVVREKETEHPRPENPRRLTLNRKRNRAARSLATRFSHAAERRGFEPLKPFRGLLAFQAGQFNHSCIFPKGAPKVHNISRFCK